MLVIDTNILLRCSRGRAIRRVSELAMRGVTVTTTDANVHEFWGVLTGKLGVDEATASEDLEHLISIIRPIGWEQYAHLRDAADRRLRHGGKKDWPALAAAMALDAQIWSDDADFFGVGVPVWSTPNVHLAPADRGLNDRQ